MPGSISDRSIWKQILNQAAITVSGTSAPSAAFGTETYAIRIASSTACYYNVGDGTPVATTATAWFPANWIEYILVNPGQKVAFLQQTAGGVASVTELST